jgi:hypothetical protein
VGLSKEIDDELIVQRRFLAAKKHTRPVLDLSGQRFASLTAIRPVLIDRRGKYMWLCECDCGEHLVARSDGLKRGRPQSCGCAIRNKRVGADSDTFICTKCRSQLPRKAFSVGRDSHGLQSWCKQCERIYRERNKDKIRRNRRNYYGANKERLKQESRKYAAENRQQHNERGRAWRQSNPEKCREMSRKWKERYPERYKEKRLRDAMRTKSRRKEINARQRVRYAQNLIASRKKGRDKATERRKRISDAYVRQILVSGTMLRGAEIPSGLIELKRAQLLLARELKERVKCK